MVHTARPLQSVVKSLLGDEKWLEGVMEGKEVSRLRRLLYLPSLPLGHQVKPFFHRSLLLKHCQCPVDVRLLVMYHIFFFFFFYRACTCLVMIMLRHLFLKPFCAAEASEQIDFKNCAQI